MELSPLDQLQLMYTTAFQKCLREAAFPQIGGISSFQYEFHLMITLQKKKV